MAATQYLITTYEAIRTLLQGHAPFWSNVRAANFIDWTTPQAKVKRFAIGTRAPADFAEIELVIGTNASDPIATETAHYGDAATWLETLRDSFVLRMTFPADTYALPQLLERESLTALRKAGSKLGLNTVFAWGPVATVRRDAEEMGKRVRIIEQTIPIQYLFQSAELKV